MIPPNGFLVKEGCRNRPRDDSCLMMPLLCRNKVSHRECGDENG